jgi:hypothetical protein
MNTSNNIIKKINRKDSNSYFSYSNNNNNNNNNHNSQSSNSTTSNINNNQNNAPQTLSQNHKEKLANTKSLVRHHPYLEYLNNKEQNKDKDLSAVKFKANIDNENNNNNLNYETNGDYNEKYSLTSNNINMGNIAIYNNYNFTKTESGTGIGKNMVVSSMGKVERFNKITSSSSTEQGPNSNRMPNSTNTNELLNNIMKANSQTDDMKYNGPKRDEFNTKLYSKKREKSLDKGNSHSGNTTTFNHNNNNNNNNNLVHLSNVNFNFNTKNSNNYVVNSPNNVEKNTQNNNNVFSHKNNNFINNNNNNNNGTNSNNITNSNIKEKTINYIKINNFNNFNNSNSIPSNSPKANTVNVSSSTNHNINSYNDKPVSKDNINYAYSLTYKEKLKNNELNNNNNTKNNSKNAFNMQFLNSSNNFAKTKK